MPTVQVTVYQVKAKAMLLTYYFDESETYLDPEDPQNEHHNFDLTWLLNQLHDRLKGKLYKNNKKI